MQGHQKLVVSMQNPLLFLWAFWRLTFFKSANFEDNHWLVRLISTYNKSLTSSTYEGLNN